MQGTICWRILLLAVLAAAFVCPGMAQDTGSTPAAGPVLPGVLPDAPAPPIAASGLVAAAAQPEPGAQTPAPPAGPAPDAAQTGSAGQTGSSSQAAPPGSATGAQKTQHQKAADELKQEEKQRILGVAPNFGTSYNWRATPLSAGQKLELAFRSATDPFTLAAAGLVAGYHEALDEDTGFGWGAEGYGKRWGAAYLDAFDGAMIGNGMLPAVLRQDPRYFRLGHGSFTRRFFYAVATSYICRGDNGKWQPNVSNVGGNIVSGAISNLYYPAQNSGWGQTIANGMIVTTEGTVGGVLDEFWPDISRKLLHRDPTHGADAAAALRTRDSGGR